MKRTQVAVIAMLPVFLTAAVILARQQPTGNATGQYQRITIQLPERWVPFSATTKNTDASGNVDYGRLYRSSDGSNTTVMRATDGEPVITIHHFPSRQTFAKLGKQGWMVYPFAKGKRTEPQRALVADASRVEKLDVVAAGGPVYELRGRVKRTRWAVALNGFPIYTLDSYGNTFELVDIVVGEPPAELFAPPANVKPAQIRRDEVFGGVAPSHR